MDFEKEINLARRATELLPRQSRAWYMAQAGIADMVREWRKTNTLRAVK